MRTPRLSIRALLYLIVAGLTGIIAIFGAIDTYENWQRQIRLTELKQATVLGDELFDAAVRLSVERDVALSMLHTPDRQIVDQLKPLLLDARDQADRALAGAIAHVKSYSFPELAALRAKVLAHFAAIKLLRPRIDGQITLEREQREMAIGERWSTEVSALLQETDGLWVGFMKHFTDVDPIVTQHLRFKHLLRTIIDYAGRERALIGQLIVENADPTPKQVAELLRGQGAIELSWQMTRVIADQSGLLPAISAAYTDAQSHYATMHEMIQDMFYVPGSRHSVVYPIGADLWFELSTEQSDSLEALRAASRAATRDFVDGLIARSERVIAFWAGVLLLALGLCGFGFWVIAQRVLRPINNMIGALLTVSRDETALTVSEARDEVGKLERVLAAFRRRTDEIKHAAEELDRSQSQLRAVVDHTIDGMIVMQATGDIGAFNPACEHIFGYTAAEAVGQNIRMLIPLAHQTTLAAYLLQSIDKGFGEAGEETSRELVAQRKDGSVFPIELSLSAFRLGGHQQFSAIVRDITRRKETEQELQRHTRALERSNKELDDFAYIASHDLKEPLRGIHNHARFLLEDNAEKLDEESVGRLNRLVHLSQRMERLVNDLLYFSRLGRQELAIQQTDVGELVKDIESTLDVFLGERNARIVMPKTLPTIVCDTTRVSELFRNLITNAVKYNDKPEKTIEIGFRAEHATPEGTMARNVFYVKDDGRGIDPEFHLEIFRIFKRLQSSDGSKEEGTGVGLTFVKKIVERHGGRIWLESQKGKGTTFLFTLETSRDEHERDAVAA